MIALEVMTMQSGRAGSGWTLQGVGDRREGLGRGVETRVYRAGLSLSWLPLEPKTASWAGWAR